MKYLCTSIVSLVVVVFFLLLQPGSAIAAKQKIQPSSQSQTKQILKVISNDGDTGVNGSVLNPSADEVNVLLQQLLFLLKKGDLGKLSITLSNALDSTKTYAIPREAISIQKKKINKKYNKYLVVNLFNLKTPSGISISPSSLPKGNYRLRILGKESDLPTDNFNYQTPALIVGTVKSNTPSLITVEDVNGEEISERTVSTNSEGVFFTEVRANKVNQNSSTRRSLKTQDSDQQEIEKKINTGIVHAVSDKDLYAVVLLNNDAKNNDAISNKPIEINETSTLTANLAKSHSDLALEVAKDELKNLESEGEESEEGSEEGSDVIDCPIDQYADDCINATDETFASIGANFRNFLRSNTCSFKEYELIKKIILASPESTNVFTGKGYCEFSQREENTNKPCDTYTEILNDYKSGLISQLPCPPDFCEEFQNIKPPKCFTSQGYCEGNTESSSSTNFSQVCRGPKCTSSSAQACIHKPTKDLNCARIGADIDASVCNGNPSTGFGYTISTSSQGNQFCVSNYTHTFNNQAQTLEDKANECEVSYCHRECENKFGSGNLQTQIVSSPSFPVSIKEDLYNCHISCDAKAGRYYDCSSPYSKYFSNRCCVSRGPYSTSNYQFNTGSPGTPRTPIPKDIQGCLCFDPNNFDEKGFIKTNAVSTCKDKCPTNYENDPSNPNTCLPTCQEGFVRDQYGNCRKKCPQGFIEDESGNCKCPEGQALGQSGKCETYSCPEYCKSYSTFSSPYTPTTSFGSTATPAYTSPNYIPPECQKCAGSGSSPCPTGFRRDPASGNCISNCGSDQYSDSNGTCRCSSDGSVATSLGPEGCKKQGTCPPATPYKCSDGSCRLTQAECSSSQFTCPPPYIKDPAFSNQCLCPQGTPYELGSTCVTSCPSNLMPSTIPGSQYSSTRQVCKCSDGTYPNTTGTCGQTTPRTCAPGELATATNACICAQGASFVSSASFGSTATTGSTCQCINGQTYTVKGCTPSPSPTPSPLPTTSPSPTSTSQPITLNSAVINNGNTISLNYSQVSNESTKLKTIDNIDLHAYNFGFGSSSGTEFPLPWFYSNLMAGTQVKLCYVSNSSICSQPVTVTESNIRTCNAGEVSSLTSINPCKCALYGSPNQYSNYTCSCGNGRTYTNSTGCGTHICASSEIFNYNDQCACASGAKFEQSTNKCICPSGQPYTVSGCTTSSSPTPTPTPSPTSILLDYIQINQTTGNIFFSITNPFTNTCLHLLDSNNVKLHSDNYLFCNSGWYGGYVAPSSLNSTFREGIQVKLCKANDYNTCSNLVTVTLSGSFTSHTCALGEVSNSSNPCTCASGATVGSNGQCQCTNGQVYASGGCPTTQSTASITSAVISGTNLAVTFSTSFPSDGSCAYLKDASGVTLYSLSCGSTTGTTINAPISTFPHTVVAGDQVKICKSNDSTVCSPFISVTNSTPVITLSSVTINSSGVTISFGVDPYACLLIKDANNNTLKLANLCGVGSFNSVFPTSDFIPALVSGTQVKLCNQNNSNNCSNLVSIP